MYSSILILHIVLSIILSTVSTYIVFRSFFGIIIKYNFSVYHDFYVPVASVSLLYLELILGLLLYSLHMNKLEDFISQTNANDYFSSRFWAVEHTILMFFSIIFGHLVLVYAKNLQNSTAKFRKNFIYFGLSFVLIMISLLMNIPNNA